MSRPRQPADVPDAGAVWYRVGRGWCSDGVLRGGGELRQEPHHVRPSHCPAQIQQVRLADMLTEITKAQLLALQLGRLKDAGTFTSAQVSLAKRNNVNIACECAREARRLLGGNGILVEYHSMRHMANLESVYTYEGTHDVHGLILGHEITGLPAY